MFSLDADPVPDTQALMRAAPVKSCQLQFQRAREDLAGRLQATEDELATERRLLKEGEPPEDVLDRHAVGWPGSAQDAVCVLLSETHLSSKASSYLAARQSGVRNYCSRSASRRANS